LGSTAVGSYAESTGDFSTALGVASTADSLNSTAVGAFARAVEGVNATQATQISGLQAFDTAVGTRVSTLEAQAIDFDNRLDDVVDRSKAGTAAAIALGGNSFLPGKSFNMTGNVGTCGGAVAGALQFGARSAKARL
jgi:hypothetical protein